MLIALSGGETPGERWGDSGTDEGCSRERARRVYNAAVLLTGEPTSCVSSTREDNFIKKTKRHAASAAFIQSLRKDLVINQVDT